MSDIPYVLLRRDFTPVKCRRCGAVVVDSLLHTEWHATLDAATAGDLYGVSCADSEHEITEMCWRCGREAREIYGEESK